MPDVLHRTGQSILFVGVFHESNVLQTFRQSLIFLPADVPIHPLRGFLRKIVPQPTEVRAVWIPGLIRFRVVKPVRDYITLLPEAYRIGPEKQPGEANIPEVKSTMRTVPMIPDCVVNRTNHD